MLPDKQVGVLNLCVRFKNVSGLLKHRCNLQNCKQKIKKVNW